MKIIDDFEVTQGSERWVGILIKYKDKMLWIFNVPVHGSLFAFGDDPKQRKNQRF